MTIKVPSFKDILNIMCSFIGRIITFGVALVIFIINLICLFAIENYNSSGIMCSIGWILLLIGWINTYLYTVKCYGKPHVETWQEHLKKKHNR